MKRPIVLIQIVAVFFTVTLLLLENVTANYQTSNNDYDNGVINEIVGNSLIKLKENIVFNENSFFETYRNDLPVSKEIEFKLIEKSTDELGYSHYKYIQKYKNLEIEFRNIVVHTKYGFEVDFR